VLLTDPEGVFGYQNVAPVFRQAVLRRQGPAFASTVNSVSRRLTLEAIRRMNASVVLDRKSPATVAADFLRSNGLR
jgi:osmoprotectant transport system substrate-binding protein